jgi:hypothetical protein
MLEVYVQFTTEGILWSAHLRFWKCPSIKLYNYATIACKDFSCRKENSAWQHVTLVSCLIFVNLLFSKIFWNSAVSCICSDLDKLGGLLPVIQELNNANDEIRTTSAWVLGTASQNNALVQNQVIAFTMQEWAFWFHFCAFCSQGMCIIIHYPVHVL